MFDYRKRGLGFAVTFASAWLGLWSFVRVSDRFDVLRLPPGITGFWLYTSLAVLAAIGQTLWAARTELNRSEKLPLLVRKAVSYVLGVLVLLLVGAALALRFIDQQQQASRPYVAVVASTKSIDFMIPKEFVDGFRNGEKDDHTTFYQTSDGRRVDIIDDQEDLGNQDEARRIARNLVADPNCILVIGNSNSTLTATTLDEFLAASDRPTYILPIATATDIMTKAKSGKHGAVLRMIPDNAAQADAIGEIVSRLAPKGRVAVYADEENVFYSQGLSRDIASHVRASGGRVVVEQSIGPSNSLYQSLAAWDPRRAPPQVIVYVGVAHDGFLLIDQLANTALTTPVVFTDGSMVKDLKKYIARIPNRAFVLSPVEITKDGPDEMPTYEPIGKDAYQLAKLIIEKSNQTTRAGVREWVSQNKTTLSLTGVAGTYQFAESGNNTAMKWKVYEVTKGKLIEYRP